jgi:CRISPR-associated protein Cas6
MNRHGDLDLASTTMTDVCFSLSGGEIAEDHSFALERAVKALLPWLEEEPEAGILPLSGLARGNGVRFVGRRSRLILRLPNRRVASADFLIGKRLDLGGDVVIGSAEQCAIFPARVVYSAVVAMDTADEVEFLARCNAVFAQRGLTPQMVTGKARELGVAGGTVHGFSLMLHGLTSVQTVELQEAGLGAHRGLGCGIFVPHKSVAAVGE